MALSQNAGRRQRGAKTLGPSGRPGDALTSSLQRKDMERVEEATQGLCKTMRWASTPAPSLGASSLSLRSAADGRAAPSTAEWGPRGQGAAPGKACPRETPRSGAALGRTFRNWSLCGPPTPPLTEADVVRLFAPQESAGHHGLLVPPPS